MDTTNTKTEDPGELSAEETLPFWARWLCVEGYSRTYEAADARVLRVRAWNEVRGHIAAMGLGVRDARAIVDVLNVGYAFSCRTVRAGRVERGTRQHEACERLTERGWLVRNPPRVTPQGGRTRVVVVYRAAPDLLSRLGVEWPTALRRRTYPEVPASLLPEPA